MDRAASGSPSAASRSGDAVPRLPELGVTHVVNCRAQFQTRISQDLWAEREVFGADHVAAAPMWDHGRAQPPALWAPAARVRRPTGSTQDPTAGVLIHCQQGRRRSAMVAYAMLRLRGHDPDEAARLVLSSRAPAKLVPAYRDSVEDGCGPAAGPPDIIRQPVQAPDHRVGRPPAPTPARPISPPPAACRRTSGPARAARATTGPTSCAATCASARACGHHFAVAARERLDQLSRGRAVAGAVGRAARERPAPVRRPPALPGPGRARRGRGGTEALIVRRDRRSGGHALRRGGHGLLVPRRQHGRGGGREARPRLPTAASSAGCRSSCVTASGGARMQEGVHRPDADGQDHRRVRADARRRAAGDRGAGPPHHRRRVGVVRLARRRDLRRARRADLLLGPARDRADHAREAAPTSSAAPRPSSPTARWTRWWTAASWRPASGGCWPSCDRPIGARPAAGGRPGRSRRRARGRRGPRPAGPVAPPRREGAAGRRGRGACAVSVAARRGGRFVRRLATGLTAGRPRRASAIWETDPARPPPGPPVPARLRRAPVARVRGAPRRPPLRRRPRDRGGHRPRRGRARSPSSATRRAATPTSAPTATSGCPARRATARRCG